MLSGEVNMWRSIVIGNMMRNDKKPRRADPEALVPAGEVAADVHKGARAGSR